MKKKCNVPLVRLVGIIAIAAVIGLTIIACEEEKDDGDDGGKGSVKTFTSIEDFKKWLEAQPENTEETAYNVKINISDLKGDSGESGSLGSVISSNKTSGWHKYVSLDLSGSTFTTIGESAFYSCNLTSITIPNSVTTIGDVAFAGCESLTSVTIGSSVTSIGNAAFNRCNFTSITIPNSVTSIGVGAFGACYSLTSITIPSSVTSIGALAFNNCDLISVTFQGTIDSQMFGSDRNGPFQSPFDGDLRDKYLAEGGGPGTYTRPNADSNKWTKQ